MNERIRLIRDKLNLTRAAFGEKLGVSGDVINNLERGRVETKEPMIKLICSVYSVDEKWLRTGEGGDVAMFVKPPRNEELAAQIESFFQGGADSFRERLVSLLLRLSPEQWDALEEYARELTAQAVPTRTNIDIEQEAKTAAATEAVEVFDQVYLEKKAEAESSASPSDTGGTAGEKMA